MSRPGDVVEFRSGLMGFEAPRNLGILVARERRKGVAWVRLVTLEGLKEMKAEHVTRRAFSKRYDGPLADEAAVRARLQVLVGQHAEGGLAEEAEDDLGALEARLWEATCEDGRDAWTEEELAGALHEEPSPQQLRDVRAALERCRRPGIGRFETAGKGDLWRPWTRAEHDRMRAAWQALQDLRARLVAVEQTDEGRVFRRIEPDDAGLSPEDRATLAWVQAAMVQFVEHDGVPDGEPVAGIAGLGAAAAFGLDLHRALGFLAQDWIRSEHTSRSSDYVHFLLESGLWTPDDAVASLMRRHVNQEPFFEHKPDDKAQQDAAGLPEPDLADDPDRSDLRHLECYTIDPADAKDFDDAVGIEERAEGVRLWVHVADVSHYVRPGTHLDRHAKMRATSVYLPGRVLPMLPHRIADHLCSLRDDGDRFALSVAMDLDADGRVLDATFHKSIIRVRENLAYADALDRAHAGQGVFPRLLEVAERMRRHRRGLALETGELKVLLESSGFSALEKRADEATQMIETFMVAANEAVARHLADAEVPLLLRCHPLPDASKAERFRHQLETMGIEVPFELPEAARSAGDAAQSLLEHLKAAGGRIELFGGGVRSDEPDASGDLDASEASKAPEARGFNALSPEDQEAWLRPFREVVEALGELRQRERADVATMKLLACMGRAYYTPANEGHFGLASTHYCHFTSPIRRYPDLVVHRNLKWLLAGRDGPPPHAQEDLERLCDHCSDQERAAADLERRINSAGLVLASLTGTTAFSTAGARATGITPGGLFVRLEDGIEARIPARELPGGPFQVDEWESMLYLSDREAPQRFDAEDLRTWTTWHDEELGEVRRVRVRLGDRIQVRLAGRDVAEGKTSAVVVAWSAP